MLNRVYIVFGDEDFGAYITIPDSIPTSSGDNMYLNVTYIYSTFVATNGGVDIVCIRVVKPIAVTNDLESRCYIIGFRS